jgi:hypothetical protein
LSFVLFREVIKLSLEQAKNFAGNCYEVINQNGGRKLLVISTRGWACLSHSRQSRIAARCDDVISCPVDCIEDVGGGGIRCMMTGIFNLPRP